MFESIDEAAARLAAQRYFAGRELATSVFLATKLRKPLYLHGPHGCGKSALAVAAAGALDLPLASLHCDPQMDPAEFVAAWGVASREASAIVVDEVDAASAMVRFELVAQLGDVEPDWEVPPLTVVIDSGAGVANAALQRISIFAEVEYPDPDREVAAVMAKVPGTSDRLAWIICGFAAEMRAVQFYQRPGVGDVLNWTRAVVALRRPRLDADTVEMTLDRLLRDPRDVALFHQRNLVRLLRPGLDVAA